MSSWSTSSTSAATTTNHAEDSQPNESINKRARAAPPLIIPAIVQKAHPTLTARVNSSKSQGSSNDFRSSSGNKSWRNTNYRPNNHFHLSNKGNNQSNPARTFKPPIPRTFGGHGAHYTNLSQEFPLAFPSANGITSRADSIAHLSEKETLQETAQSSRSASQTSTPPPPKRRRIAFDPFANSTRRRAVDLVGPVSSHPRIPTTPSATKSTTTDLDNPSPALEPMQVEIATFTTPSTLR